MRKYLIGTLIGASLMFSAQSFAAVGDEVKSVFAQFNLVINGQVRTMETVPLVYNGTSYLPVRDMANLFGYDVTYKADSRTIEMVNTVGGVTYGSQANIPPISVISPEPTENPTPIVTPNPIATPKENKKIDIPTADKTFKFGDTFDLGDVKYTLYDVVRSNPSEELIKDSKGEFTSVFDYKLKVDVSPNANIKSMTVKGNFMYLDGTIDEEYGFGKNLTVGENVLNLRSYERNGNKFTSLLFYSSITGNGKSYIWTIE